MSGQVAEGQAAQAEGQAPQKAGFTKLLFANVLYWSAVATYTPFMSAHFTNQGFDAGQVGTLLGIMPLCALLIQPLWTAVADRLGRKRVLLSLCAVSACLAPLYYLARGFVQTVLVTIAFSAFFQALLPLCDSLVVEDAAREGLEFSRVRMGGTIGYAVVVLVLGQLLDVAPAIQFVVVSAGLVVFGLHFSRVPETPRPTSPSPRAGRASGRGLLTIFDTPQIVLVLLLAFVSYTGLAFHSAFLGKYCVELGYGQGLVGVVSATSAMSEVPILLVSDRLVRRFGVLPLLKFACVAMAVRLVLVGSGVVPLMVGAQLLQSVSYMTVYYSTVTYIQQHAVPGAEARAQGVLVAVQAGLATVVANFLGGIVCDAVGTAMGYLVAAAVTLAAGLAVALVSGRTAHAATA